MTAPPADLGGTPSPGTWREFPAAAVRRRFWAAWPCWVLPLLASWVVVGLGPSIRTASISIGARGAVVAVATGLLVVTWMVARATIGARRLVLVVPVVLLVATGAWAGGRWVGVWILAGCLVAVLGVQDGTARGPDRSSSTQLAVLASVIASWWGQEVTAGWVGPALMVASAPLVHLCVSHPEPIRSLDAVVRRAFVLLGEWLRRLLMFVLGIVLVLVPWAVQRLTRWDPTWAPRLAGSGWIERARTSGDPRRPWDPDPARQPMTTGRRTHRFVIRLMAAVCVLAVVVVGLDRLRSRDEEQALDAAAMADAPWWPALHAATEEVHRGVVLNTYDTYRLPDAASPYLNIVDGTRSTWSPPTSGCAPLRVWMLGGSAMFGDGQRDDATIASRLAQLADERGIALQIENLGVPGDVMFIEARRLEARLAAAEQPPDLVVFYDGYNDLAVRHALDSDGAAATDEMGASWVDATFYAWVQRYLSPLQRHVDGLGRGPSASIDVGPSSAAHGTTVVGRAVRQYSVGFETSRRIVADHGLHAAWFLQPNLYTRSDPVDGEPIAGDEQFGSMVETFRDAVPDEIVDLSSTMDSASEPVYYDDVHTNEAGADLVARSMLDELSPQLAALCETRGTDACC